MNTIDNKWTAARWPERRTTDNSQEGPAPYNE